MTSPAGLREGEWRLAYPELGIHPAVDVVFGSLSSGYDLMAPPEVNFGGLEVNDAAPPRSDGLIFGVDYQEANLLTFEINVHTEQGMTRHASNLNQVGRLRSAWAAPGVRGQAGAVAALATVNAGRGRMVYGRPRKFAAVNGKSARQGHTPVIADFQCADDVFYDATVKRLEVGLVVELGGGLIAPLASPLSTAAISQRPGLIQVGGDRPTWTVIKIYGPVTNPVVEAPGLWRVELQLTLAEGNYIVVDPRPWVRSVLLNGSRLASAAGALTRHSRLADVQMKPGSHEVVMRGADNTGTSRFSVEWQDAYSYL